MFRGPLVLATLLEVAKSECSDCAFHMSALEEFSADYHGAIFHVDGTTVTTEAAPWWSQPDDHSSVALKVANLQAKLNINGKFADSVSIAVGQGQIPVSGMPLQEEFHVDGTLGRASFHFATPILNMCFQLDTHMNFAQQMAGRIQHSEQQAEQMEPMMAQQATRITVDGEPAIGFANPHTGGGAAFTDDTHPVLFSMGRPHGDQRGAYYMIRPTPSEYDIDHAAMKFDNYRSTVGSEFEVRACEIQSHASSQALLAANPAVKDYVASRLALHQATLLALFQPFNKTFIPVEIEDLMAPVTHDCATEELAQIPVQAWSTMQAATFSVCAFVTGLAVTLTALRKKHVAPAEEALLSAQA